MVATRTDPQGAHLSWRLVFSRPFVRCGGAGDFAGSLHGRGCVCSRLILPEDTLLRHRKVFRQVCEVERNSCDGNSNDPSCGSHGERRIEFLRSIVYFIIKPKQWLIMERYEYLFTVSEF